MNEILSENQKTWNIVADQFFEASALPVWGCFGVGEDLNLIPEIKGKVFLEVACGSGRSINYLVKNGVKKVYGLDLSEAQLTEARRFNQSGIDNGQVVLFQGPMEEKIDIEPVDVVFSVYGIGWTPDPAKTFANINSYLKPGGTFIWSWDHSFFSDVAWEDGKIVVTHSYHDENPIVVQNWKDRQGANAHVTYRKTSTWFKFLVDSGFEVVAYHEPKPINMDRGFDDPTKYYSIQKAEKVPVTFIFVCKKK